MPDIAIKRSHHLGLKGAKMAADKMAEKLGEKFGLAGEWEGDHLNFSRPGVSGKLGITETTMTLEVTLGFLLKAMKGPIENAVNEQLDKVLTETKPAKPVAAKKPVAKKK